MSVDSLILFREYFMEIRGKLITGYSVADCLLFLEERAREIDSSVSSQSIANCRGRWYELIFFAIANFYLKDKGLAFLKLGTATNHHIYDILKNPPKEFPENFSSNVSIPDSILVRADGDSWIKMWQDDLIMHFENPNGELVECITSVHQTLIDEKIDHNDCLAFCSLKTSLRPDRRYQPMYEAEYIKAFWIYQFGSGKFPEYIMIGQESSGKSDAILGSNLSLLSLTGTISNRLTVDRIFIVSNLSDLESMIDKLTEALAA